MPIKSRLIGNGKKLWLEIGLVYWYAIFDRTLSPINKKAVRSALPGTHRNVLLRLGIKKPLIEVRILPDRIEIVSPPVTLQYCYSITLLYTAVSFIFG